MNTARLVSHSAGMLGRHKVRSAFMMVGSVIGNQRTFCNLPKKDAMIYFHEAINDTASDETSAHMSKHHTVPMARNAY